MRDVWGYLLCSSSWLWAGSWSVLTPTLAASSQYAGAGVIVPLQEGAGSLLQSRACPKRLAGSDLWCCDHLLDLKNPFQPKQFYEGLVDRPTWF